MERCKSGVSDLSIPMCTTLVQDSRIHSGTVAGYMLHVTSMPDQPAWIQHTEMVLGPDLDHLRAITQGWSSMDAAYSTYSKLALWHAVCNAFGSGSSSVGSTQHVPDWLRLLYASCEVGLRPMDKII